MSESTVNRTKGPDAGSARRKQWPIALTRRAIIRHSALFRRIILVRLGRRIEPNFARCLVSWLCSGRGLAT